MIEQHGIDYCIVINFSSRFANVTAEEFIKDYIINNHVKEVVADLILHLVNLVKEIWPC